MMLSLASVFRKTRQATSPTSVVRCKITAEEIQKYKTDTQTLARWLDVSIVKRKGRAFEVDRNLITASKADFFPTIKGSTLTGHEVKFPDYVDADAKLVLFSFKHYGFTLLRSWIDPFVERFGLNSEESAAGNSDSNSEISASAAGQRVVTKSKSTGKVVIMEVCFIEYGFLSMAKGLFVNNIKSQISSAQQPLTAVSFGGVMDFASRLLLPNKYTGYAYLLDRRNRVRWRGSGSATEGDLAILLRCTEELATNPKEQQ